MFERYKLLQRRRKYDPDIENNLLVYTFHCIFWKLGGFCFSLQIKNINKAFYMPSVNTYCFTDLYLVRHVSSISSLFVDCTTILYKNTLFSVQRVHYHEILWIIKHVLRFIRGAKIFSYQTVVWNLVINMLLTMFAESLRCNDEIL